jgi:hypothetical protein
MGKPEASMTLMMSLRLGGQVSRGPRDVFDQSLACKRAAISGTRGTSRRGGCDVILIMLEADYALIFIGKSILNGTDPPPECLSFDNYVKGHIVPTIAD